MALVRSPAELGRYDTVRTPLQRLAEVVRFDGPRVHLQYVARDGSRMPHDEVVLHAEHLELVQRAAPAQLSAGYFKGGRR